MKHTLLHKVLALCLLLALLLPTAALIACQTPADDGVNVPVGMQNATGNGSGYYFFVPSNWQVDHSTGLTMVTVSLYSTVTLSLYITETDLTVEEYFAASRADIEGRFTDFAFDAEAEMTTVGGNAALYYTYHGKYYTEKEYKTTQYLTKKDGHIFVITYTASPAEFDQYAEAVGMVAADFVFTGKEIRAAAEGNPKAGRYDGAPEGMRDISLEGIHDYRLFIPDSWQTDMQSGIVSAYVSPSDRSNVSLSRHYPPTGVNTISQFFEALQPSYSTLYDDYEILDRHEEGEEPVTIGGREGARYVMRGKHGGITYRTMQIFFVRGSYIYVFTYTVTEANFDTHLATVDDIISKIIFP